MMMKQYNNASGFAVVGIVLVIVVLGVIGGAGYLVVNRSRAKKPATTSTATTKSSSPTKTTAKTPAAKPQANPYSGWKQYCDSSNKVCFKYPATGWALAQTNRTIGTQEYISATVRSANKEVSVAYSYPYIKDGGDFSFLTMSISDIPGYPNLKVVGGVYLNAPGTSHYAQYAVVDKNLVAQDGLVVGKTSQFINTARFALNGNASDNGAGAKYAYQFAVINAQSINDANYSLDSAKAWFSTQDAKDGLLMLESLSPEHS